MNPRVLGQDPALSRLSRMLASGRVPSALLFHGPDGVGKRLSARLFAAALNCQRAGELEVPDPAAPPFCGDCPSCVLILKRSHPDVLEVDEAFQAALLDEDVEKQKTVRVDTARELSRRASLKSTQGGWTVFIVDKAHALEIEAANALLKGLEEPAPGTVWILISSQRERLLPTILSRCQAVAFRALAEGVLREVLSREKLLEEAEARRWAPVAEGSLSRALLLARSAAWVERGRGGAAYWEAAQSLPRGELASAREAVSGALEVLLAESARGLREGSVPARRIAELLELKAALRANASPHLVLQLALLKTETPAA